MLYSCTMHTIFLQNLSRNLRGVLPYLLKKVPPLIKRRICDVNTNF